MEYQPPSIPEELFEDFLIAEPLKKQINNLKQSLHKSIREIDFLYDVLFSFKSSLFYKEQFLQIHKWAQEQLSQGIKSKLTESRNLEEGHGELILGISVPPIHLLFYLDSFVMSAKRTLDFLMKLTVKILLHYEDNKIKGLSINKLAETFERNRQFDNLNEKFEASFPEFRTKFIGEWKLWMKDLNSKRDAIVHFLIEKEAFFDTRFFRDKEKESEYIEMKSNSIDQPLKYIETTYNQLLSFVLWNIDYILKASGGASVISEGANCY